MDHEIEQEEIKPLIYNYIFHIILFAAYLALHLIMYFKLFWVSEIIGFLFEIFTYFNILYILFPIFPLKILINKNYKERLFSLLKIMTIILLIISITCGLLLFIIFLINAVKSKKFCKECPFNLGIEHLKAVFGPYYNKNKYDDIKNQCASRRCVLDQENPDEKFPYLFLCNYDPTDEFDDDKTYTRKLPDGTDVFSDKQLTCDTISINYKHLKFSHQELYSYLDICFLYSDFYRCKRFNKPEKYNNINLKDECPDNNYLLLIYIISVLILILDIIIAILPWGIEYITFKKLLIILNSTTRRKVNSKNSTAKNSEISKNEESFKKEATPIIISPLENVNTDQALNQDDEIVLKLKKKGVQINHINLSNSEEKEKDEYKHHNNQTEIVPSDRLRLNARKIEINIKTNDPHINTINQYPNRNKDLAKHEEITTINANTLKTLEINIVDKNDEA